MSSFTGGCLCGGVCYTYEGDLRGEAGAVTVCHCASCRKAQGYASGVVPVLADAFVVTVGDDLIREYESSPGKKRAFCTLCGSPLYSRRDDKPEALRLRLGSLDDPPESLVVDAHTFTLDVPAWAEPTTHRAIRDWSRGGSDYVGVTSSPADGDHDRHPDCDRAPPSA